MTAMSTNPYQIWFEKNGQKLLLPVNPEKIDIKQSSGNQSLTLPEFGETTILQAPKAITLSFSSFLPSTYVQGGHYATAQNSADSAMTVTSGAMQVLPHFCIDFIMSAMTAKTPLKVTITKCNFTHFMSVESFKYSQSGGDVGTYEYSISLKVYRSVAMKKVIVNSKTGTATASNSSKRVTNIVRPKTYTARPGDSLFTIAKKYYGDPAEYKKIYDANKKVIGASPTNVKPGMTISLP